MIVINVQLVLDCKASEAADAANEILRGQQRQYSPASCLMDYAVSSHAVQISDDDADPSDYQEGEAFRPVVNS